MSTKRLRTLSRIAIVLLLITSTATPAHACWDGYYVDANGVAFTGFEDSWSPALVQDLANWHARIASLLPSGVTVRYEVGVLIVCNLAGSPCKTLSSAIDGEDPKNLFHEVARLVNSPQLAVARARQTHAPVYTVQVASFSRRASALQFVASRTGLGAHGFVVVGGFPANNDAYHVVETTMGGRTFYRVYMGAFLNNVDAQAAATAQGMTSASVWTHLL